jgi:CheY-like chemotaxis protein
VELSNGSIEIQSEKQKGTKIEVFLPSDLQNEVVKTKLKNLSMQHKNPKSPVILIAEDEDTNFFVLDLFIRKSLHMETVRAANGLEALELFKSNPDIVLVLMDIKMPVLDGISATKKIKALKPDIPAIAITAYALSGDEHKLRMAGCDDYVAKPVQKKELLRKINTILENKQNS